MSLRCAKRLRFYYLLPMLRDMLALGIDIGGSGMKAAPVDCVTGIMLQERYRIATPSPATPKAMAAVVAELVRYFDWTGPIGIGFPAVVQNGVVKTASNVDKSWIGAPGEVMLRKAVGLPVRLLNDADAAGLAETRFGRGKDHPGVVLMITVGTGIGSALFDGGKLIPNTELGHLEFKGAAAEKYVSDAARKAKGLAWSQWGDRFNAYLLHLERLFSPDLILVGGGASKKFEKFSDRLSTHAPVKPAKLGNEAGIIGAACFAAEAGITAQLRGKSQIKTRITPLAIAGAKRI